MSDKKYNDYVLTPRQYQFMKRKKKNKRKNKK